MRKSHQQASSTPLARHQPLMAAIVGLPGSVDLGAVEREQRHLAVPFDQELGHAFLVLSVSRSRGPFRNVNSVSGQCYASCQVHVLTAAALA
jgi:hypothetical protein